MDEAYCSLYRRSVTMSCSGVTCSLSSLYHSTFKKKLCVCVCAQLTRFVARQMYWMWIETCLKVERKYGIPAEWTFTAIIRPQKSYSFYSNMTFFNLCAELIWQTEETQILHSSLTEHLYSSLRGSRPPIQYNYIISTESYIRLQVMARRHSEIMRQRRPCVCVCGQETDSPTDASNNQTPFPAFSLSTSSLKVSDDGGDRWGARGGG